MKKGRPCRPFFRPQGVSLVVSRESSRLQAEASAVSPAASIPATQHASSSSPVPPLAPAEPMIAPALSLINAAPVWGRNLPPAVAASVTKKFGLSLARLPSALLDAPIATDAHAFPFAMSR